MVTRDGELLHEIAQALLQYYAAKSRQLPWRDTSDPYRIWVSEVMLQQTRVETVIPYFQRFITRFPDVHTLSQANDDEVIKYWEGLGYYSRIRRLHEAVREVDETYGGIIPSEFASFRVLPGVGDYTAGAVLSIAYGKDTVAVDGNAMRVFSRVYCINEDVASANAKRKITKKVQEILPSGYAGQFNQAVMDLGATICTRSKPKCDACPIHALCCANISATQDRYPVKKPKKVVPTLLYHAFLIRYDNRILVRQRPKKGLLAGLWELPNLACEEVAMIDEDAICDDAMMAFSVKTDTPVVYLGEYEHAFSHVKWRMYLHAMRASSDECASGCRFVSPNERSFMTFGTIFNRMMQETIS